MPEVFSLPYSDPFGTGTDRPCLWIHIVGPSGEEGNVLGVVDSGADATCLPLDFASLMGYASGDLAQEPMVQAGGSTTGYVAKHPCSAWVVGLEQRVFELMPTFIDGAANVLWGRADFFREFGVAFEEASQRFSLIVPD